MKKPLRILHIEDSEPDSELAKQLLLSEGISCDLVRIQSERELVQALEQPDFDLIFADCSVPGFSGMRALELAKERCPDIPFIFISGTISEETAIESLRNGATDYVFKDRFARLVPAVQRAVAEREEKLKNQEMQQRLQRSQQMEAVGTLAGGVAHDFNNILTIIMGHAALIPYEVTNHDNILEIGETIRRAVQRGADLVQQLASFARKSNSSFTSINPNQHIRDTAELLRKSLPDGVRLKLDLAEATPNILADPAQLDRVLINLVANSRDAQPHGGSITISTRMVSTEQISPQMPELVGQDYLCVSVSDTGCGMDEKTRQRIFEPFFTTKPRGKGTGLGLSVVYGLMQSHNGVVDVQSEVGRGTTVSLYFPPTNKPGNNKPRLQSSKTMSPLGSETILIVEDEPEVRYFLKIIFQYHGYHVLIASNAEEAVDLFDAHQSYIDMLFSDIGLPGMDGFELCAKLKPRKPSLKLILCSGYAQGAYKTKMAEQGIDAFIPKPYEKNDVLNTVRAILDKGKVVNQPPPPPHVPSPKQSPLLNA